MREPVVPVPSAARGCLAGGDRLRIERQAKVIIGAGEDNLLIADAALRGGIDFVDAGAERIQTGRLKLFAVIGEARKLIIQSHGFSPDKGAARQAVAQAF